VQSRKNSKLSSWKNIIKNKQEMSKQLTMIYRLGYAKENDFFLLKRCLNCAACIVIGAAGGHRPWSTKRKDMFHRGLMYHFMNAIGIILSSLIPTACMRGIRE
jgi:ferredoxin-like protein FixX